jgi:hypothetical protein
VQDGDLAAEPLPDVLQAAAVEVGHAHLLLPAAQAYAREAFLVELLRFDPLQQVDVAIGDPLVPDGGPASRDRDDAIRRHPAPAQHRAHERDPVQKLEPHLGGERPQHQGVPTLRGPGRAAPGPQRLRMDLHRPGRRAGEAVDAHGGNLARGLI